jgi:predicted nucleic acid-binding protein
MARSALVLDASVAVKWFSPRNETSLDQALAIRDAHISKQLLIVVPDLFYYEVTNALVHKDFFSNEMLHSVASALFALDLYTYNIDSYVLMHAVDTARQKNITIYDACYLAIAASRNCPLVTANPRHQKEGLGCQVIPIEKWRP